MSSDHDAQKDEMLALESIYDSDEFSFKDDNGEFSGQFNAFVSLPGTITIEYQFRVPQGHTTRKCNEDSVAGDVNQIYVKFLPPIEFSFTLPSDYPSVSPPRFTLVCVWLGRKELTTLCKQLDSLWNENKGAEILFQWLSFLKEESFSFLQLGSTINLTKQYTYNTMQIEKKKKQQNHEAKISPTKGTAGATDIAGSSASSQPSVGSAVNSSLSKGRGRGRGRGRRHLQNSIGQGMVHRSNERPSIGKTFVESNEETSVTANALDPQCLVPKTKQGLTAQFDSRVVCCESLQVPLISHLKEYNKARCVKEFQRNIYLCRICFEDKPGGQCIEFDGCGHIFCKECVGTYFEVHIKDGNVHGLTCPEKGCKSEAHQSQISELVTPELFERYDTLLLSSTLDEMEDIVYCPRKSCQSPVIYEKGEKMARCAHCSFTFCTLCRMGYHGIDPCRIKLDSGLIAEYESASDEKKQFLEKKYGRKTLQDLLETGYSQQWIQGNSKKCPHCQAAIEKSDGCNKMTCWKCNTYFCWLCSNRLNPSNPYNHFNSPTSACFQKLFLGIPDDDDEEDIAEAEYQYEEDDDYVVFAYLD